MTMTATEVLQRVARWFPGPTGRVLVDIFSSILTDIAGGILPALAVGTAGTSITSIKVYSQTITAASVAAAVVAEQTFTVTGLDVTDKVFINHAATGNATGIAGVRVSATNTLAISYVNPTAGALVPGAGTYKIVAMRSA